MRFISLGFNVYLSNKLNAESIGIFTLIMSVYLFFVTIATSGISMVITCIISKSLESNNKKLALQSMITSIKLSLFLGLFSGILIIIFSDFIISFCLNNLVSKKILFFIAIGLPFIAISSCINGFFTAIRKPYINAFIQFFELIIKIFTTIILLPNSISYGIESICISLIISDVISEIVSFLLIYFCYIFYKNKFFSFKCRGGNLREIVFQSIPIALTAYIRSGLSTLKQIIIPNRLEKSGLPYSVSFAKYGMIQGMVMPLLVFPNIILTTFGNLLMPEFSRLSVNMSKNILTNICHKIFQMTSVFSIYIFSIFFIFANDISLAIYQNIDYGSWIKTLSFLVFFMYMDTVIDGILKGLQKYIFVVIINILDLIITISLLYFLLPLLGIWGFILSIFVSELFNFVLSFLQLWKLIKFKIDFKNYILKPISASFFSYLILNTFSLLEINSTFALILSILIFSLIYFCACIILKLKFR